MGGISKETLGDGSDRGISHGCSKASGNVMEGGVGEGVRGGNAMLLSTIS